MPEIFCMHPYLVRSSGMYDKADQAVIFVSFQHLIVGYGYPPAVANGHKFSVLGISVDISGNVSLVLRQISFQKSDILFYNRALSDLRT